MKDSDKCMLLQESLEIRLSINFSLKMQEYAL